MLGVTIAISKLLRNLKINWVGCREHNNCIIEWINFNITNLGQKSTEIMAAYNYTEQYTDCTKPMTEPGVKCRNLSAVEA